MGRVAGDIDRHALLDVVNSPWLLSAVLAMAYLARPTDKVYHQAGGE